MYLLLLTVIYLAFISLGLPDSLLGSAWPAMREGFGVPLSYSGMISMVISGGTIVSSLLSERLTRKFTTRVVTVVSVLLTAVALFGFSCSTRLWHLILWAVPYGLGAGAIDSALNNYVALHYTARHMSWLHSFWGVGTIVSPYIMSYALTYRGWQDGYRMVSYLQMGIVLVLLLTLPLWRVNAKPTDEPEQERPLIGVHGALRIRGVPYLLLGFFGYCAAEATVMLWASSYLVGVHAVDTETAAAFGSLFFIGMTAGRFVSGFITDRMGDHRMIRTGVVIALFGAALLMLPVETDLPALAGLIIIGLGCAPVYPAIIHSTPSNFGAENSQGIIGIQMTSAYIGSTFMPPLFGALAGGTTLAIMPYYIAAFLALTLVMTERTFALTGSKG